MKSKAFSGLVLTAALVFSVHSVSNAQAKSQIIGCYSDLSLIEREGLVVGTGSFRIKHEHHRYTASFTELIGDGGEYAPTVELNNVQVEEKARRVYFDIVVDRVLLRRVFGSISKNGIKMHWRGHGTEIGDPNPFLSRRWKHCS